MDPFPEHFEKVHQSELFPAGDINHVEPPRSPIPEEVDMVVPAAEGVDEVSAVPSADAPRSLAIEWRQPAVDAATRVRRTVSFGNALASVPDFGNNEQCLEGHD